MNIMIVPVQKASALFGRVERATTTKATFPFGLAEHGVHEICESAYGDFVAGAGFALAAACATHPTGAILWICQRNLSRDHGNIFKAAIANSPLLFVETNRKEDVLWASLEGIQSGAIALVIVEVEDADFTASRRLVLATERYGTPVLLVTPYARSGATAAHARWRISSQPSAPNPFDQYAPGKPHWRAHLERSRLAPFATGKTFDLEYDEETLSLRMVAGLASHMSLPKTTSTQPPEQNTILSFSAVKAGQNALCTNRDGRERVTDCLRNSSRTTHGHL